MTPTEAARRKALQNLSVETVDTPPMDVTQPASLSALAPVDANDVLPPVEGIVTRASPAVPPVDAYAQAKREAQRRGLALAISMAGAGINEAITGAKAPEGLYERMLPDVNPVRDYLERLKLKGAGQKEAEAAALRNPDSPESKRRLAAFTQSNPALAKRLGVGTMPMAWADVEAVIKGQGPVDLLTARAKDQELRAQALGLKGAAEQRRAGFDERSITLHAQEIAQRNGLEWNRLDLERQKMLQEMALQQMKLEAEKEREGAKEKAAGEKTAKGQTLPATEAASLGQTDAAISALRELDKAHEAMGGGVGGMLGSLIPASQAKLYEDKVLATAQAVGTILEGGKLAAGDEVKYRKMLPDAGDSPERRKAKIENVIRLLQESKRTKVKALGDAGYNVGAFQPPSPPRTPASQALPKDSSGQPTLDTTALPPPPAGKVRVRIGGKVGLIPRENLEAAKARGAVEVP